MNADSIQILCLTYELHVITIHVMVAGIVGKKKVYGIARVGGKTHVGKLSDVPEVQNMIARFRARAEERRNVVMVRLSNEALARIDQLVESTLAASRSEAAAILIGAGIDSQKELFDRLRAHTDEIQKLKEKLRQVALDALKPSRTTPATDSHQ